MAKYSYEFKLQVVQAYLDFYFVRFVGDAANLLI